MTEYAVRLPDVGEGVAEAELVEWLVKVGDHVQEEQPLAVVMTDKASIEVPTPVAGEVVWLAGEPGQDLAVGGDLVRLRVAGAPDAKAATPVRQAAALPAESPMRSAYSHSSARALHDASVEETSAGVPGVRLRPGATPVLPRPAGERPLASPSVRRRALEAGVDLRRVAGSGPAGRIQHDDLDRLFAQGPQAPGVAAAPLADDTIEDIPVIGLRRRIVEKMRLAHERVADLTYVDEVDVSELETLRSRLNGQFEESKRIHLTPLPFLMRAIAIALAGQPRLNAHFDDDAGVLRRFGGVHLGIAAQTGAGLVVPVVRHVEARDLWDCAAELARVTDAAKGGTATRAELSGSTITLSSLGPLGGIMSTPIVNYPEVAIVGVNRIAIRPWWDGQRFVPRRMMNLSCSFDHRVVDGWDAATFVQRIKGLLETPALLFVS